jgi:hypothetical protein
MISLVRTGALALLVVFAAGCGDLFKRHKESTPPGPDTAISRTEGTEIAGAPGWRWIPFDNAFCTDSARDPTTGQYTFGTSTTGLAISWSPTDSTDVILFLDGGGACFEFLTCGGAASLGIDKTASTGPFGPTEFSQGVFNKYPSSWVHRENLPAAIRDATFVFVPYCTGDVHGGDRVTTYSFPGLPSITWHHVGRSNVLAFMRRLTRTFASPGKLVIAGSSGGGFGTLVNYTTFRTAWPNAKAYLVDDSGPTLIGDAVPPVTRDLWYSSWDLGAALDPFCPECRSDLSRAMTEIVTRYPQDRVALLSHLQDAVIRGFFATISYDPFFIGPMPADVFEAELRRLGTERMDPATTTAKYFFTATPRPDAHPTLQDPSQVTTPLPGLPAWIQLMLSDSTEWTSVSDP